MEAARTRTKKRPLEREGQTRRVGRDRRRLLSEIMENTSIRLPDDGIGERLESAYPTLGHVPPLYDHGSRCAGRDHVAG